MNKFAKLFTILTFSLVLLSCAPNLPPTSRKVEESNVYSVLLNEDTEGYIGDSPVIIVVNKTFDPEISDYEGILKEFFTLNKETLANYRIIDKQIQTLQLTLSLSKPYEIISIEEIDKRETEDPEWFRTYTITAFSGIGFNNTFDQALVYVVHDCGGECAIGVLYFLIRDKNGWRIEGRSERWIS